MMVRSLLYVTMEARELPIYDGLIAVDEFLRKFENIISAQQQFDALKWALRVTPARWWDTHQVNFEDWRGCRRMMCL